MHPKPVKSLQRAIAMLETVALAKDGISLKDLAEASSCSQPAAFNMAQTFVSHGFLQRSERPVRYFLGNRVAQLVRHQDDSGFRKSVEAALSFIEQTQPEASGYYCELHGSEVMVRTQLTTGQPGVIQHNVDTILTPYSSVGSMIHLAFWPENRIEQYTDLHPFEIHGAATWLDEQQMQRVLESIRKDELFFLPMRDPRRLRAGAPILAANRQIRGSFTVAWTVAEQQDLNWAKQHLAEITRKAAAIVSASIK